jgi:hypothetical protein
MDRLLSTHIKLTNIIPGTVQTLPRPGMIFARGIAGLSYCETEESSPEDIEAEVNVLPGAAMKLAG